MTRWKISVDKKVCISSAMCVAIAPGRFVLDGQQRSGPVEAVIEPDEDVRDAAASCPSEAISLVDADTGQPVDLDLSGRSGRASERVLFQQRLEVLARGVRLPLGQPEVQVPRSRTG